MKSMKTIMALTIAILLLSVITTTIGLFSKEEQEYPAVVTTYGESIELYNKGIYARDSLSMGSQAVAQDFVTIILGVPLLIISLLLLNKKSAKGICLLTGTLGYFLYTYASYSFLIVYNPLYLVYVLIMILSFYSFILSMNHMNKGGIMNNFSEKFPVKSMGRFMWIVAVMLGGLWLGRILPTVMNGTAPINLEHYSTLGIQTLDLGFVVPASLVAGYLLSKRNKWGYILSVVLVIKAVTMTAAVSAMTILMRRNGVKLSFLENFMFPVLFTICVYFLIQLLRNIKGTLED